MREEEEEKSEAGEKPWMISANIFSSITGNRNHHEKNEKKLTNIRRDKYLHWWMSMFRWKKIEYVPGWKGGMCFVINQYCHFEENDEICMKIDDRRTDDDWGRNLK